jgi:hypothetical protein
LLDAALVPHLFDVTQRHELLAGNDLAGKPATLDLPAKAGDSHPATGEGEGNGIRQPKRIRLRYFLG